LGIIKQRLEDHLEQGLPGKGSCLRMFYSSMIYCAWLRSKLHELLFVCVVFVNFWVSAQKPPNDHEYAARRRVKFCLCAGFSCEPLGGTTLFALFLCCLV